MLENFQLMILLNPINGIRNRKEFDLTDSFKGDIFISCCVWSQKSALNVYTIMLKRAITRQYWIFFFSDL